MDDMAMLQVAVEFGNQVKILKFFLPASVKEGDEERNPAKEVWDRMEPGGNDVVEFTAFQLYDDVGEPISSGDWLRSTAKVARYRPTRVKLYCRHLLHAELY